MSARLSQKPKFVVFFFWKPSLEITQENSRRFKLLCTMYICLLEAITANAKGGRFTTSDKNSKNVGFYTARK